MIVDDDVIIRKGLSKNIPWEAKGFQVVAIVGDGEEAYRQFIENSPDIVISDIKMPFVDGLELSKKILAITNEVKIILLTGYEEFQYAKQALEIKVFDYILKPVDLEQLFESVKRAAAALEMDRKISWSLKESRPLLQQRFLTRLINDEYHSELEAQKEADFLELVFRGNCFTVLVVKVDDYFNSNVFQEVADREVAKFNIIERSKKYLGDGAGEALSLGGDEFVLIYCSQNEEESVQHVLGLGEKIKAEINDDLNLSITIGVGTARQGLLGICASFKEAKAAIEFRHIIGKNQVLSVEDTGLPIDEVIYNPPVLDQSLGLKVKMGLNLEALAIIDDIEAQLLLNAFVPLSSVQLIGMQLAMMALGGSETWSAEEATEKNQLFFVRCCMLQEAQTIEEIFNQVRQLITELTQIINRKRESLQAGLVGSAIEYIEENYSKEGLSLSDVAREVHVSPVYLSIIFKKERNINFSEFLNEVRMTKAMELLRNSDLKTYEVAERIGFSNPQYFSVCFKKHTGYSPSDFKKQ